MQLQNQYCVMSIKQNLNQTLSVSTQKFIHFLWNCSLHYFRYFTVYTSEPDGKGHTIVVVN